MPSRETRTRDWARLRELGIGPDNIAEPFADYTDFDDCVSKNQQADDPQAYCATIKRQAESQSKESLQQVLIQERLRPFAASFFAAEPGTSENNREYDEKVLRGAAADYVGKRFIMDHNYQDSRSVQGAIMRAAYETRHSPYTRQDHTGLWLDGVGLMDEDVYRKMEGDSKHGIPPLIRGVSIGGRGEAESTGHGTVKVRNFRPMELSATAFPGIPTAHVAVLAPIAESIKASRPQPSSQMPKASVPDPIFSPENQGVKNMPTLADAIQEASATVANQGTKTDLSRSPLVRQSYDGRTVAFPSGVKAKAPPLPVTEEKPTPGMTFNPTLVPQAAAEPPPITQTLPETPPATKDTKEAEAQIQILQATIQRLEAELAQLREQGPTRGNTISGKGVDMAAPPGGLPPQPWLQGDGAGPAGPPPVPFLKTEKAEVSTLPAGMYQRTRELLQTQTVSGNAVPRPVPESGRRYHARTEDIMATAQKHLETVQRQRPNAPLAEQQREAWYRGLNEILQKPLKGRGA